MTETHRPTNRARTEEIRSNDCTAGTSSPSDEIAQALASLHPVEQEQLAKKRRLLRPSFKPLVLRAAPNARVRRDMGSSRFECFIGERRIGCGSGHPTPDKAWICLARYVTSRAFTETATRERP